LSRITNVCKFLTYYLLHKDQEVSYGLNLAIAGRGVIVKDKVFHNLETSELQKAGATYLDKQSGIPLHVRGDVTGRVADVSKAQFAKLLKLVCSKLRFSPQWDVQ